MARGLELVLELELVTRSTIHPEENVIIMTTCPELYIRRYSG